MISRRVLFSKFQLLKKHFSENSYSNLGITPARITDFLGNYYSGEIIIRRKFDEYLQNLLSPLKINKNYVEFCKIWCNSLEKSQKSGMAQRKKYRSRQELSDEYLLAKFGFDTAENEPPKGSKKCML